MLEQAQALQTLQGQPDRSAARAVLADWAAHAVDGRAKFWVSWRALQLRRKHEAMLSVAEYLPLEVRGAQAQQVVAFARRAGDAWLVVIAGRLYASIGRSADRSADGTVGQIPTPADWGDTAVVWPEGSVPAAAATGTAQAPWLEDAISGQRHGLQAGCLMLAQVLAEFPVAALFGVLTHADDPL